LFHCEVKTEVVDYKKRIILAKNMYVDVNVDSFVLMNWEAVNGSVMLVPMLIQGVFLDSVDELINNVQVGIVFRIILRKILS